MRSFADRHRGVVPFLVLAVVTIAASVLIAQDTPASALFDDAHTLEVTLRKDISAYKAGTPSMPLIRRARILVGTYEDIARLFPDSGQGDKSLWQGVSLAADVFDVFKDGTDRAAAVRLTEALETKYPSSPLLSQAQRRISTLALPSTPAFPPSAGPAEAPSSAATATAPRPSARQAPAVNTTTLQAIRREVLPDVLRISLELDREVAFHEERLDGPPRVFVDLQNTRAAADVQDARLVFDDDVVRQIRVGRQLDRRVRVVLDLTDAPAHSVYTLYNPFRIVIDFERPRAGLTPGAPTTKAAPPATAPPAREDIGGAAKTAAGARAPLVATKRPAATSALPTPTAPVPGSAPDPSIGANPKVSASPAPAAGAAVVPTISAPPKRETVFTAPPPARTPGGLSVSRQLGLGVARVVIDPGHGGQDPGAKQGTLTEAELVLDVAFRLEQLLQKDGIEVILTRRSNVYVPLEERPEIAMREEADLYVSIHANASADARVRGVETYILNFAPNAASAAVAARENMGSSRTMSSLPDIVRTIALNNKIDESRDLARQVQATLVEKLSKGNRTVRNLGVKQAPFAVLVGADMPSILAEIGFITNKQDAALVKTAVYRQQIAEALATGIARYQKRLKPSQVAAAQ